jgi:hypothetical protein
MSKVVTELKRPIRERSPWSPGFCMTFTNNITFQSHSPELDFHDGYRRGPDREN